MSPKDYIVLILGGIGLLWYFICLIILGTKPSPPGASPDAFRQFMSLSLTTIGTTLATFVGALLGLKVVSAEAAKQAAGRSSAVAQTLDATLASNLQWVAAGLYVLSLVIALFFWYRSGDQTDPTVSNLGKSLLGLIVGALAIVLNIK